MQGSAPIQPPETSKVCRKCGGKYPDCGCKAKSATRVAQAAAAIGVSLDATERENQALRDANQELKAQLADVQDEAREKRKLLLMEQIMNMADYKFSWRAGKDVSQETADLWVRLQRVDRQGLGMVDRLVLGNLRLPMYVATNLERFITEGVGITEYEAQFVEIYDEFGTNDPLDTDYRPVAQTSKQLSERFHKTKVRITAKHPLGSVDKLVEISLEYFVNLLHVGVWDRTMDISTVQTRMTHAARGFHHIATNRYDVFGAYQQNTIKIAVGWVMSQLQENWVLDFHLAPRNEQSLLAMAIEHQKSNYLSWGQLNPFPSLVGLTSLMSPCVRPALRLSVAIGTGFAYRRLIQETQDPWWKALSKESQSNLLQLTTNFFKNSVSSFLDGLTKT